ncbi:hypothetical protein ALC62_12893 [Cyphomyrmex costatus]|uniref:Uncharacterized protein n=1 Tax=Cyphomyrmex costatus TaxID=456900 RepID=A0A151IAH1_9HYME|nr:hypothetical protein ALC62_12893 [Cyphomyrmex costatus]
MYVDKSNTKSKQHCCIFCLKLQSQLARHLETVHRDEPEVKKFSILPKKNPERKKIIDILRKKGNFKHNKIAEINKGKLIVSRRPHKDTKNTAIHFTACKKCNGYYAKSTIRHHVRKCFKRNFKHNRGVMVMGKKVTCRIHEAASEQLRNIIFPILQEDKVVRAIRFDKLVILYGNQLCLKYTHQHQHDMIRAKLRLTGRFKLAFREINNKIKNFESLYHPRNYDDCISAIKVVAGYNNIDNTYKAPATATSLSTLIKKIAQVEIMECIKQQDAEKQRLVEDFLKLLTVDIGTSVNTTVAETQSTRKRHKVQLPSMEDIKTLYTHLKEKRIEACTALKQFFSFDNWLSLTEATLTSVHVFNRRRAGEIERTLIEDFKTYERINKNMYSDMYTSLSAQNKKIAERYVRFSIRGKLGRTVPVLLPNDLLECINLILQFREEAKVPKQNPYVFGLPSNDKRRYKYLRACTLMRKFAVECNAVYANTLRGTILRKHVATHCMQLNLNDVDVSDLANFMGHAEKIHKDIYRQPLPSIEILKISQYLEAVQGYNKNDNDSSSSNEFEEDIEMGSFNNTDNTDNSDKIEAEDLHAWKDVRKKFYINKYSYNSALARNGMSNYRPLLASRRTPPYGKTKRIRWSVQEKNAALKAFGKYINNCTLPSFKVIQETRKKYHVLRNRTTPQIKTWISNQHKGHKNHVSCLIFINFILYSSTLIKKISDY